MRCEWKASWTAPGRNGSTVCRSKTSVATPFFPAYCLISRPSTESSTKYAILASASSPCGACRTWNRVKRRNECENRRDRQDQTPTVALTARCGGGGRRGRVGRVWTAGRSRPRLDNIRRLPRGSRFAACPVRARSCTQVDLGCGQLAVPLDYSHPEAEQITLQIIRARHKEQSNRIGSLIFHPGGPGDPGLEYTRSYRGFRSRC
jgi:hypothetical protein